MRQHSFSYLAKLLVITGALILSGIVLGACQERVTLNADDYRHTSPSEYFLYVPQNYSADKTWPLWVHIHGDGGNARGGCWDKIQQYADENGFILLCPSLNASDNHLYYDYGVSLLNPIIYKVQHEYNVGSKIYLSGFSGGAYFIQIYAYEYPSSISGLTIMSAGVFFDKSNSLLRSVPMLITVGKLDSYKPDAAQMYYDMLVASGYNPKIEVLKGVGHVFTEGAVELSLEQFHEVYP
jgi:phospholipase/carboxylesterase